MGKERNRQKEDREERKVGRKQAKIEGRKERLMEKVGM